MENLESGPKNIDDERQLSYGDSLNLFIQKTGLIFQDGKFVFPGYIKKSGQEEFTFLDEGENKAKAELLENPEFLKNYFKELGYSIARPKPIIDPGGTTLFISAGVQILNKAIFQEADIDIKPQFVAQPVFRSQYIDSVQEGYSTSFINICTEKINPDADSHFASLSQWLNLLSELGLKKEKTSIVTKEEESEWGGKKFRTKKEFIYYDGLEIGDASYNCNIPQKTREPLALSDIGFGVERLKWILQGGSYFAGFGERDKLLMAENLHVINSAQTLTLLAGSGLKPANKEHGYRFRLFSKRLVDKNLKARANIPDLIHQTYSYWCKWTKLGISEDEVVKTIQIENERNFNRILLDTLKEKYSDVNIDINLPTTKIINLLKGTSVDRDYLESLLKDLNG